MTHWQQESMPVFELFRKQWALVTAGTPDHFNACTVSWGSMGTLWTRPEGSGQVITAYIHPGRYTHELLLQHDTFTVSFFGHRYIDNPFPVEKALDELIGALLRSQEYVEFLVGQNGDFDQLVKVRSSSCSLRLSRQEQSVFLSYVFFSEISS